MTCHWVHTTSSEWSDWCSARVWQHHVTGCVSVALCVLGMLAPLVRSLCRNAGGCPRPFWNPSEQIKSSLSALFDWNIWVAFTLQAKSKLDRFHMPWTSPVCKSDGSRKQREKRLDQSAEHHQQWRRMCLFLLEETNHHAASLTLSEVKKLRRNSDSQLWEVKI